jgi:four helix bundle protein
MLSIKQILIYPNTEEAQAEQSKADFIAKMSIARKESREILYWLRTFKGYKFS